MNKERILKVADAIEWRHKDASALGFNMYSYVTVGGFDVDTQKKPECGTVACIAGWAVNIYEPNTIGVEGEIPSAARRILDLDDDTSWLLFLGYGVRLDQITSDQAVYCLRHLAETGEVDWQLAVDNA